MLPILELGPIHLGTYQAMYALGMLVAGITALHRLVRGGIPDRIALRLWIFTIWGGLCGSWLLHQVVVQVHTLTLTGRLVLPARGTTVIGGLLGGAVVALILCRRWGLPTGKTFDLGTLPVPLGLAIGRLGCLAAGCCHGRTTDSCLGMHLPDSRGFWAQRYPTQLLSSAVDLGIFLLLVANERCAGHRPDTKKRPFSGFLTLLFVILFCSKRILLEFLRVTRPPVLGPLTWAQLITAVGLVIALGLLGSRCLVKRSFA